jgi:site-specific DNA recombinase
VRIIAYSRVSTQDQSDHGVSLQAQRAKLAAYAGVYDLEVVEFIQDAGESAKSLNRTGLQRALEMLRNGQADGLAIVKLDRLTRSVGDFQTLIDGYFGEKAGKQLFSVSDSIDTRTAAGRLVLNVLLSVAQWEREATGERTKSALQHKISCRQRVGKVRYGFDLGANGKSLVSNGVEQSAICPDA